MGAWETTSALKSRLRYRSTARTLLSLRPPSILPSLPLSFFFSNIVTCDQVLRNDAHATFCTCTPTNTERRETKRARRIGSLISLRNYARLRRYDRNYFPINEYNNWIDRRRTLRERKIGSSRRATNLINPTRVLLTKIHDGLSPRRSFFRTRQKRGVRFCGLTREIRIIKDRPSSLQASQV